MNQVDVVVGNSSSGVYEAPSLNAPSVDIGDRQKGRERAASVFHARAGTAARSRPRFRAALAAAAGSRRSAPMAMAKPAGVSPTALPAFRIFARCCKRAFMTSAIAEPPDDAGRTLIIAEAGVNHSGSLETGAGPGRCGRGCRRRHREIPDLQRQFAGRARGAERPIISSAPPTPPKASVPCCSGWSCRNRRITR